MKHKIQILDKNIANQIAAGEVAERPTLILKELIENSLDAGATSIRVLLKDSGFTQMRVIDSGEIPKTKFIRRFCATLLVNCRRWQTWNHCIPWIPRRGIGFHCNSGQSQNNYQNSRAGQRLFVGNQRWKFW